MRLNRAYIAFGHDIFMAALSFLLSLFLRTGTDLLIVTADNLIVGTILFTGVAGTVFWFMRMYRGLWRYASLNDLLNITRSVTLAILIFFVLMFAITRLDDLPRSLPFINWFILIALLGGPRFIYRLVKDRHLDFTLEATDQNRIPVLLAGADDSAEMFVREMSRADAAYQVVGIVANNPDRVGRRIHGVEVMATFDGIPAVTELLRARGSAPQRLIVPAERYEGPQLRVLLDAAEAEGMSLARLPSLTDFKSNLQDELEIKPVDVEDLLGRPQTALDRTAMRELVHNRRILITGAGGSIGSELVRQISDLEPSHVTLLENSEYNLYAVDMELGRRHADLSRSAVLGDVRDSSRIDSIFVTEQPDIVFHAGALKHVPMVEANPFEGIATNVFGTVNMAEACRRHGTTSMVLISTDKAVNPSSVMGATKRLAEIYCQALDVADGTRFVTVRFGNVLGSTGSVVELFRDQLARGGPLTVTHAEMTRYFMTAREAVELVLQAAALGTAKPENAGKIYVLDMGEPVRIIDLARQMIRLAGYQPDTDIKIEITGPRPGEKLYEELLHAGEPLLPTTCKGLLLGAPRLLDLEAVKQKLAQLRDACEHQDSAKLAGVIGELVPEYSTPEAPSAQHSAAE